MRDEAEGLKNTSIIVYGDCRQSRVVKLRIKHPSGACRLNVALSVWARRDLETDKGDFPIYVVWSSDDSDQYQMVCTDQILATASTGSSSCN